MKRKIAGFLAAALFLLLSGCGAAGNQSDSTASRQETAQAEIEKAQADGKESTQGEKNGTGNALVVYFSRMGNTPFPENTDAVSSASLLLKDGELKGNAQALGEWIAAEAGCGMFEIVTETSYPADYMKTTDVAKQEQSQNARPALKTKIADFDRYDTFYLVFPNWWGDLPQALYSFFDEYDFAGKNITVFVTHGGSSFSNTIKTIQSLEPDAQVVRGLSVRDSGVPDAESEVRDWVKTNG